LAADDNYEAALAEFEAARQARQQQAYETALDACEDAIQRAEDALDTEQKGTSDRVNGIESHLLDAHTLHENIETEREAYKKAKTRVAGLADDLKTAEEIIAAGNSEDALTLLEDAEEDLADLASVLAKWEFDDLTDRLDDIRIELRSHRKAALQTKLDELEDALETTDPDNIEPVEEELDVVAVLAEEHGMAAVGDRVEKLREHCRHTRNQIEAALTPVPEMIPTTTRHPLSYDEIQMSDPIGRGGNADVYHATASTDKGDVEVALKQPRMGGTLHTKTFERLLSEAETWQRLDDHDHVVSVVDYREKIIPAGIISAQSSNPLQRATDHPWYTVLGSYPGALTALESYPDALLPVVVLLLLPPSVGLAKSGNEDEDGPDCTLNDFGGGSQEEADKKRSHPQVRTQRH